MSKINLEKKQTDLELLTELNNNKKDYYLTYDYSIKKGTVYNPHISVKSDNRMFFAILKLLSFSIFAFILMPYMALFMTAELFDTTVAEQLSGIKRILGIIFSITAEQLIFGIFMFFGAFFVVGPFIMLFSCNGTQKINDDDD